ncbi:MAG: hypothetical protein LUQ11_07350 [Methylococcaceae bacterium]|nr:hypothetical protein [Methylococcaceae bacterium]
MNKPIKLYGKFLIGLSLLAGLFGILPAEFVVAVLLFGAVTYGGVLMIRLATSYDLKTKRINKT